MREELWKPVVGYEGIYEVSNLGSVASLNYKRTGERKILKLSKTKKGYLYLVLRKDGCPKHHRVHRLVAAAFVPNKNGGQHVNHINENKMDNRAENLEWCTNEYNHRYGTINKRIAAANKNGKCSKPVIATLEDGTEEYYPSMSEVNRRFGKSSAPTRIGEVIRGKHKTAYGRTWRFAVDT